MRLLQSVDFTEQVDEVDTEKGTIVLDVDGVYLTFELAAIKTVLPLKETASLEGAIEK